MDTRHRELLSCACTVEEDFFVCIAQRNVDDRGRGCDLEDDKNKILGDSEHDQVVILRHALTHRSPTSARLVHRAVNSKLTWTTRKPCIFEKKWPNLEPDQHRISDDVFIMAPLIRSRVPTPSSGPGVLAKRVQVVSSGWGGSFFSGVIARGVCV